MGSLFWMMPCILVSFIQKVNFRKNGLKKSLEIKHVNRCCGFRDGVLVV